MKRVLCLTASLPVVALAMSHGHSKHHQMHHHQAPTMTDSRQIVEFPAPVYEHTLKSMREHLEAIHTVIEAVAVGPTPRQVQPPRKGSASAINTAQTGYNQDTNSCPQACANWAIKCT